VNSEGKNMI